MVGFISAYWRTFDFTPVEAMVMRAACNSERRIAPSVIRPASDTPCRDGRAE